MSQSATPATTNDMTTCLATFEKERFCSFPHRHGDATGNQRLETRHVDAEKTSISHETSSNFDMFDTLSNRLECHKDMTSCLETFEKERFCGFPHRHGEATGKPETRDKTRRNIKTSISCETSSNLHKLKQAERTCFAASPIDTARPQEDQRLEMRHVGAPKRAFRARLPLIFTLCSCKIDVFLRVFKEQHQNRCFVRGFRQFSAHRTKCHDGHGICTLSPLDAALPMRFAKNAQHDTSKVLRLPRKMTMDTSKVLCLPRKLQHIF